MLNIIKKNRALSHILFWMGVILLFTFSRDISKNFYSHLVYSFGITIPKVIASYLTIYFLIPRLFLKKKYVAFVVWFLVSAYLISVTARIIIVHGVEPLIRVPPFEQESLAEIFSDIYWLSVSYFPGTYIMVVFFGLVTFLDMNRRSLTLENEKTTTELKMLKAQLNPHFLFNTLNNIYTLSLDNSPKTSTSIGKLSEILDHILYRCDSKFVSLSSEVALLENYIDLEKLRYDDRLKVTFEKDIDMDIEMAPLILLSLVENAFKHGAGEDGGSPIIDISLTVSRGVITFIVGNSVAGQVAGGDKEAIGLENIKKQLELIYTDKYSLLIDDKPGWFTVTLVLGVNNW